MKDISKIKKWQIENSEMSEILEILFRAFSFPRFQFFPKSKIENSVKKQRQWNI